MAWLKHQCPFQTSEIAPAPPDLTTQPAGQALGNGDFKGVPFICESCSGDSFCSTLVGHAVAIPRMDLHKVPSCYRDRDAVTAGAAQPRALLRCPWGGVGSVSNKNPTVSFPAFPISDDVRVAAGLRV